jgi:hypothetical protein
LPEAVDLAEARSVCDCLETEVLEAEVLDKLTIKTYLVCQFGDRKSEAFQASDPRGLLLADFPRENRLRPPLSDAPKERSPSGKF